jgi:hypothetical protein
VSMGSQALYYNTTGSSNTALGRDSLANNTTASSNTAVGYQAGYSTTTGANNTYLGYQAGYTATTASSNVVVGLQAGLFLTTGARNTFIGPPNTAGASGWNITTGNANTVVGGYTGNNDGLDIRTGDNYAVISDGDGNRQITMKEGQTLALDSAVPNAGTGITFPATQSASSNANTLDDYEEGTWTPVLDSDTNGAGRVTTVNSANYTKIGNTVFVQCYITLATLGSGGSGALILAGLPFTSKSSNYYSALSIGYAVGLNANLSSIGIYTATNTTKCYFNGANAVSSAPLDNITFSTYASAGMAFIISGSYQTA